MSRSVFWALVLASSLYLPAMAETDTPQAAATTAEKPLIEINFDRNYVYFDRLLRQGVRAAEKAKSSVVYEVVSYPSAPSLSPRQNARMAERAQSNLRSVVDALRDEGIPTARIEVSMRDRPAGAPATDYDSVAIFVR